MKIYFMALFFMLFLFLLAQGVRCPSLTILPSREDQGGSPYSLRVFDAPRSFLESLKQNQTLLLS